MDPIRTIREHAAMTQHELALIGGTSQPTIAAYESGSKSPTVRTVQRLARAVGSHVEFHVYPRLTREDRRSIALHRVIAQRLQDRPAETLARARSALGTMRRAHPHAAPLLAEWNLLLKRPLAALVPALTDPSPYARELRQVTPFAGLLSARERADVYRRFADAERSES